MPTTRADDPGWGIQGGYHDVWGRWCEPSPDAAALIRQAMGAQTDDPDEPVPAATPLRVVRPGEPAATEVTEPAWLILEDGTQVAIAGGVLPPDLPLGYHRIEAESGRSAPHVEHLIVAPERGYVDPSLHVWGITAQLYAARSRASWGMGDLGDLGRLAAWMRERGGATIGLNPLHASAPGAPPANSPYSPSSRRWRDPIYLDIAAIDGAADTAELAAAAEAGRALNAGDRIDRARVWELKLGVLEAIWGRRRSRPDPALARFRDEHGGGLALWGTYCAIAERHGPNWPSWPAELQAAAGPAVQRFARANADRVDFWSWLQFELDLQFRASGAPDVVITDLAVGFAPDGFDAWQWDEVVAEGCRVGAPPDLLGPDGQNWGLPPFIPWKLRSLGYQPFAETIRANLRHTHGLRIDHVMGLLRLFWIPPGLSASQGAYVGWHGTELLDIVALESARAGATVIGEDLGTVEQGVRDQLRERGVLSTRLLWFEDDPPEAWPAQAMAAVTTHDLPTIAGIWSGVDLADLAAAGVTLPDDGDEMFRHRLRAAGHVDDGAPVDQVAVAAHARLAQAPSMLVTAALDDLVGAEHRPNVPGTIDEHANWRIPLPHPIDDLADLPLAEAITDALRASGR